MHYVAIDDHTCLVSQLRWVRRVSRWMQGRDDNEYREAVVKTLCHKVVLDENAITSDLPDEYLCPACDSIASRKRSPATGLVRQLSKAGTAVPCYEHLPGKRGMYLVWK